MIVDKRYQVFGVEALGEHLMQTLNGGILPRRGTWQSDLSQVPFDHSINELRLIDNAIKHEGVVDAELAAYPAWNQGGDLVGLDTAFERLAPDLLKYVEALARQVI